MHTILPSTVEDLLLIPQIAKKFNKPEEEFAYRQDGRIDWTCSHGVDHTVWTPIGSSKVHGCDGCCFEITGMKPKPYREKKKRKYKKWKKAKKQKTAT